MNSSEDTAIRVEGLAKRYRIGAAAAASDSLGELMLNWLRQPGHNLRRLRRLTRFTDNEKDDIIWALRDVYFSVKQGEVLGIIGRNGAGKSTLLKILASITYPTKGRIELNGRVSSLLEIGTGFHPELTGRDNVYLNGSILGMRKAEIDRKFDEIVDFSGVEKFIDTPVKHYSSGMGVRLAFAVAAHLEPEILLVDEVLAVGDARFQQKSLNKMENVRQEGRTVLFVSHNMTMIQSLCERVLLIENGRLVADGQPEEVIHQYLEQEIIPSSGGSVEIPAALHEEDTSGLIQFLSWSVSDHIFGPGNQVGSSHGCEFRIRYKSTQPGRSLKNVATTLTINDRFGNPLLSSATHFINADFAEIPPSGVFICKLGSLPLVPGKYRLHLYCAVNQEAAGYVTDAGILEVLADDVFQTGQLPRSENHGYFFVQDQRWEVEQNDS